MDFVNDVNISRLKLGLYGGLFFFSFFPIIAVSVSQKDYCILYADLKKPSFGADSNCNYCVAMAVIFGLLYSLFRLVTLVLLVLGKLTADFVLFGDLFQLVYTAVDAVAWFLVFISACILSAGINSACSDSGIICDNSDEVSQIHTAEAGAWISFVLWLVLVVVGVFWLFRQGKIPFLSRGGAASGDAGTAPAPGGTSPQMDTPAAAEAPKY